MKLPQRRDQLPRCGNSTLSQFAFPSFGPAAAGNGCSGQVNNSIDVFRPGIEDSGLRIPHDLLQFARGGPLPAEICSRTDQTTQRVTLTTEMIDKRGTDETGRSGNQYFHSAAPSLGPR